MFIEIMVAILIILNLWLLGGSRLMACIRTVALQGMLLGVMALSFHASDLVWHSLFFAVISIIVKSLLFPWLLFRSLREVEIKREVEPFLGPVPSLITGVILLGLSYWVSASLPLPQEGSSRLLVTAAMFTALEGLYLIVSRRKALSQVLGYLVMENGIYAFGLGVANRDPYIVEMGILLDVFVAVFVMGIMINHINHEFDHMDTDRLSILKDNDL
jgi:hydrogenase-4 component E